MLEGESHWWYSTDGLWRYGKPPHGWRQASNGWWYPPAVHDHRPSVHPAGRPETNGSSPAAASPASGSGTPTSEPLPEDPQNRWKRLTATYRTWPPPARIAAPTALALLVLIGISSVTTSPEHDVTTGDGVPITEPATTTSRPETTTSTISTTSTTVTTTTTVPPTTAPPPPVTRTQPPAHDAAPMSPSPMGPASRPVPEPSPSCHPSYDPCVPMATDVDCAGGSGNGPVYVEGPIRVTGPDDYGLDRDHNGIGCE